MLRLVAGEQPLVAKHTQVQVLRRLVRGFSVLTRSYSGPHWNGLLIRIYRVQLLLRQQLVLITLL